MRLWAALLACVGFLACAPDRGEAPCASCAVDAGVNVGGDPVVAPGAFTVAEWNLEFFGYVGMGPGDDGLQASNVQGVMGRIDADVWVLEEVCDETLFRQVLANLKSTLGEDYGLVVANDPTLGNADPGFAGDWGQKTAVAYRKSLANVLSAQLVQGPGWDDDFVRRRPLEVKLRISNAKGMTKDLYVLAVHLKAGAEASSYALRQRAAADLKTYLDTDRAQDAVMVVGDWNDDLNQSISCDTGTCLPSPFGGFLGDPDHYRFATQVFDPDRRTTVKYPSAIDHHLITDELFGALVEGSPEVIHPGVTDYGETTSDHFPTVVRYWLP